MEDRFTRDPAAHDLWTQGNLLFDQGKLAPALDKFAEALRRDPRFAEAWNSAGIIHYEVKDYDKAFDCYRRAVAAKPDFAEALSNLGTTLLFLRRFGEAAEAFEKVLLRHPDMPEAHNNLGLVYEQMSRTDDALRHYRRFLDLWQGGRRFVLAVQERIDRLEQGKRSGFGEPDTTA